MLELPVLKLEQMSRGELAIVAKGLLKELGETRDRMIDKPEVARIMGMTVSWLDNSQSEKARQLREVAVRYGRSRSSAVRFPLSEVIKISRESEGLAYD